MKITIDGPSGSGKSTIAKLLAKKLNLTYLDTGAMYRAVALYLFEEEFDNFEDEECLKNYLNDIDISFKDDKIYLFDRDVTSDIRMEKIGMMASDISKYIPVREKLVDMQRDIAKKTDIIMDGRDTGTVVLKDADYKFYLTADVDKRAERRLNQLGVEYTTDEFNKIKNDLATRDYNDMNRKVSPLKVADDGIIIDNTSLTIDETIEKIINIIEGKNVI